MIEISCGTCIYGDENEQLCRMRLPDDWYEVDTEKDYCGEWEGFGRGDCVQIDFIAAKRANHLEDSAD